jgi:hypothetical protein
MYSIECYKQNYITICGPDPISYDGGRTINLTEFLPDYLKDSEQYEFIKMFENFLNTMYNGINGFGIREVKVNDSTSKLFYDLPYDEDTVQSDLRISILEKIARLANLHDPNLIDIEYIQFFAKNMGYDVNINYAEFGTFGTSNLLCKESDKNKYLRFMISNLPNWYNIKSTNNMVKIMLYSFGLVGDIASLYSDGVSWKYDDVGNLITIPDTWYPTSHFVVKVDIDKIIEGDTNFTIENLNKVIRAIISIKPLNEVFKGLIAEINRTAIIKIGGIIRFRKYLYVPSNGASDYWCGPTTTTTEEPTTTTPEPILVSVDFNWRDTNWEADGDYHGSAFHNDQINLMFLEHIDFQGLPVGFVPTSWLWQVHNNSTLEWDIFSTNELPSSVNLNNPNWYISAVTLTYNIRLTESNGLIEATRERLFVMSPPPY